MEVGKYKSGKWLKSKDYKYFMPTPVNREWIITDPKLLKKIESASRRLGELNSYASFVPNIDLFIQSYVTKEVVTSSRIEGTRTNIQQAYAAELDVDPEHRDDWHETRKYVQAMNQALAKLGKLPLSNRLLKDAHRTLLSQARGRTKAPGQFRRSQNWIGGATILDAAFVPPSHEHVSELMSDLEKFLHNTKISTPHLVKVAIAHYQFETIHPFLDGNGRIGRLLITLYLVSEAILDKPLLYTSDYFEKNKSLYFDKLSSTRERNDLTGWIYFFLHAVEITATDAAKTLKQILDLKDRITANLIPELGKKIRHAQKLLDFLFEQPIVSASKVGEVIELSPKAANDLLRDFVSLGILKETTGFRRNRVFEFFEYLGLLNR